MRHIFDAKVPMRDGVRLSADVYLPEEEGAYPAILVGTPYDNTMKSHVDMASFFTRHGYAFKPFVSQRSGNTGSSPPLCIAWYNTAKPSIEVPVSITDKGFCGNHQAIARSRHFRRYFQCKNGRLTCVYKRRFRNILRQRRRGQLQ